MCETHDCTLPGVKFHFVVRFPALQGIKIFLEGLRVGDVCDFTVQKTVVGKEADFVVLNPEGGQDALAWRQSQNGGLSNAKTVSAVADILFGMMACGDDRSVAETWVAGQRVFQRH